MSCKTCNKDLDDCGCGSNGIHVSPPSECNTPECPNPEECAEVMSTQCIVSTEVDDVLCGDDVVYAAGSTLAQIHQGIVEYFCERISTLQSEIDDLPPAVLSVTGDGVDNTDPQNPVIDLSDYALTASISAVGLSGDYNDLINSPTNVSFFTNDAGYITLADVPPSVNIYNADDSLTGNRTVTGASNSLTFTTVDIFTVSSNEAKFKNVTGNNNLFRLTTPATFGSNFIQFGRNNIDNNCGQIYSSDVSISMQYNTGNVIASIFANGFQIGGTGSVAPNSTLEVISQSASALDTVFGVRNNTNTGNHFYVRSDGRIIGVQTIEAQQGINISSGDLNFGASNFIIGGALGTVSMQSFNANPITINALGNNVQIGASNVFKSSGTLNLTGAQVGNAGLVSGDTYFDTAANILSNGDLVMGRKV